jgi:hypothetical protein
MTLSDVASIGSLVSGFAVLVSLIYLSLQIRQNTKHSQALIQQGRAGRIADTALRLAELRESDGLDKCFNGDTDVDPKDVARFLYICRAGFISAEDSFLQHREGLLTGLAFESYEASLRSGMGSPGFGAGWKMAREGYEPQFRDYMDRMLADAQPGPRVSNRSLANWKKAIGELQRDPSVVLPSETEN